MGSSGWACSDILILLLVFMRKLLITFSLYSTLFSFPCPLVRTKFPSRVIHTPKLYRSPRDAQRDDASEQTEEVAEITRSYGNSHNTFLMVSANMRTAVETAVRRTAVMSARMSRVTAGKTSLVSLRMMCLAVFVLALTPSCVLDRTAFSRRTAGAFSCGGSYPPDNSVDRESHECFPPLGF